MFQGQLARLQKERETAVAEIDSLKEKLELTQAQLTKTNREKEAALSDLEMMQEKYEKTSSQTQRLMVIVCEGNVLGPLTNIKV